MDFFETRERYRRREYRIYVSLLIRLVAVAFVLWLGWQWGNYDQKKLYENVSDELNQTQAELYNLNEKMRSLIQEKKQLASEKTVSDLDLNGSGEILSKSIKFLLESDVSLEQIHQSLLAISSPINCRNLEVKNLAVATELYTGKESNLSLFQGGLRVHIDGQPFSQGNKTNPWFDPDKEIQVRLVYLGGQKIVTGKLPMKVIVPAEDWLLKAHVTESNLRGYVGITFEKCSAR